MKVAVIGGGLFGCTAALYAQRAGHSVYLFESGHELMGGASSRSYFRLHRGYHYPRSPETGRESRAAEAAFRGEFGDAVLDDGQQIYAIVEDGGRITADQFATFIQSEGLAAEVRQSHPMIAGADRIFSVSEPRVDANALIRLVHDKIGGRFHIGQAFPADVRDRFDAIVVAAYGGTNAVLAHLGLPGQPYKFQVVEKPIVRMPKEFAGQSIVVIDGPFCCLDPHGSTDLHVLGHVVETVHHSNIGLDPEVPQRLMPALTGPLGQMSETRFASVIDAMSRFIPDVRRAEYMGSTLTVRAVLADQEATDARPTLVDRLDDQVIRVLSGKIGTAVTAAQQVVSMLAEQSARKAA